MTEVVAQRIAHLLNLKVSTRCARPRSLVYLHRSRGGRAVGAQTQNLLQQRDRPVVACIVIVLDAIHQISATPSFTKYL
jgi:hypothetical protein